MLNESDHSFIFAEIPATTVNASDFEYTIRMLFSMMSIFLRFNPPNITLAISYLFLEPCWQIVPGSCLQCLPRAPTNDRHMVDCGLYLCFLWFVVVSGVFCMWFCVVCSGFLSGL